MVLPFLDWVYVIGAAVGVFCVVYVPFYVTSQRRKKRKEQKAQQQSEQDGFRRF